MLIKWLNKNTNIKAFVKLKFCTEYIKCIEQYLGHKELKK